jgi:outer membrane protein assembly factor BamB
VRVVGADAYVHFGCVAAEDDLEVGIQRHPDAARGADHEHRSGLGRWQATGEAAEVLRQQGDLAGPPFLSASVGTHLMMPDRAGEGSHRDNRSVSITRPLTPDDPVRLGGYRLLGRLGEGGMGVVYLGRSPGGRLVAVKVIRQRFADDAEYRARFRREITAAASVAGAFTAAVLHAAPDADPPWVVTAFLPGLSLRAAVIQHGHLPPDAVRVLGVGLADGLADIHRAGVVHRDLKPGNVMVTPHGPRLIDFGIARITDATAITQAGTLLGTAGYIPPELIGGAPPGPPGDVFALGAVLAFAACGRHPFCGGSAWAALQRAQRGEADLDDIVDPALRDLLRACLHPVPAQRPTTSDLVARLGPVAVSGYGTAWLPGPVAEAVDRSARELDTGADSVVASNDPTGGGAAFGDVTQPPVPAGRRVPRRAVIGAAGLGAVGVVGAVVGWAVGRDADARRPPSTRDPGSRGSIVAAPPEPPVPRATAAWSAQVGWEQPYVTAAGSLPVAWDWGHTVMVLDPGTGQVRWRHDDPITVTALGDAVYVSGHGDTAMTAIGATSGRVAWTWQPPTFGEFPGPLPPAVGGGRVVFGHERARCVDAATGRLLWTVDAEFIDAVAAGDDVVVVQNGHGGVLIGLDPATGGERWRYLLDSGGPPVVGDGLVFASEARGAVCAVHADTGRLAWRRTVSLADDAVYRGAGLVHVNAHGGQVVAFRATTGEPAWTRQLGTDEGVRYDASNALAVQGDAVLVSGTDRVLYALDAATGRPRWTFDTQVPAGAAAVAGHLVVYPTADGNVHAVVPPAGVSRAGA